MMLLTTPSKSGSYLCWVYTVIWFVNSILNQVRQHQKIQWRKGIYTRKNFTQTSSYYGWHILSADKVGFVNNTFLFSSYLVVFSKAAFYFSSFFFWQAGSCRDVGSKKQNPPLLSRFRPWISKKVHPARPSVQPQNTNLTTNICKLPTNMLILFLFAR